LTSIKWAEAAIYWLFESMCKVGLAGYLIYIAIMNNCECYSYSLGHHFGTAGTRKFSQAAKLKLYLTLH
jgi:hypothetical protein